MKLVYFYVWFSISKYIFFHESCVHHISMKMKWYARSLAETPALQKLPGDLEFSEIPHLLSLEETCFVFVVSVFLQTFHFLLKELWNENSMKLFWVNLYKHIEKSLEMKRKFMWLFSWTKIYEEKYWKNRIKMRFFVHATMSC